jgi:hypothetical protein
MLVYLSADENAQVLDLHRLMCRWKVSLVRNFIQLCFFNTTEFSRGRFCFSKRSLSLSLLENDR